MTFPVAVDSVDCLWDSYGFDHLPNGYYIDERGIIRYLKIGGFDIRETLNAKIIEDLITEKWSKKPLRFSERPKLNLKKEIADLSQQLKSITRGVEKRLRLADLLVKTGQYRKAAREYDTVLAQQPRNARALFGRGVVFHRESKRAASHSVLEKGLCFRTYQLGHSQTDLGTGVSGAFLSKDSWRMAGRTNSPRGNSAC